MTHEAVFTPQQGHFKWYKTSWQTEDANITVGHGDALRFRVCIVETGGAAGSNQDIDVEYSTDKSSWYTLGAQLSTDKKFRWRDDAGLTEHASIDQARLSCTTENGLLHENACSNSEDISASAHHEISIILEPYQPDNATTYYFRVVLEGTPLSLNEEVTEYANCTTITAHYQTVSDQAGLVDTVAKVQTAHKTVSDITGLVDSTTTVKGMSQTVSDITGLVDSVATVKGMSQTVSDLAGLVDSVNAALGSKQTVTDKTGLVDSVAKVWGAHIAQLEIAGLVDSVIVSHTEGEAPPTPPARRGMHVRRVTTVRRLRTPHEFFLDHLDDWPDLLLYLKLKHKLSD